jgi:uncharacterized membrane protein
MSKSYNYTFTTGFDYVVLVVAERFYFLSNEILCYIIQGCMVNLNTNLRDQSRQNKYDGIVVIKPYPI